MTVRFRLSSMRLALNRCMEPYHNPIEGNSTANLLRTSYNACFFVVANKKKISVFIVANMWLERKTTTFFCCRNCWTYFQRFFPSHTLETKRKITNKYSYFHNRKPHSTNIYCKLLTIFNSFLLFVHDIWEKNMKKYKENYLYMQY